MTGVIGVEGIRPALHDSVVPISDVTLYPGNARRGNHAKIRTSLLKHGQYKALPVQRSTGFVLMGNNTYAVMRDMGYTHVAVQYLDVDEAKAREMLLVDNASSDDSIYDETDLAALLAKVEDWDATLWTPDDLDDLLVTLNKAAGPVPAAADGDGAAASAAAAGAVPPDVAALAPTVLPTVPATDARYAESPEDEQARQAKFDGWTPRYAQGMTEVILVYPEPVRIEVLELINKVRGRLGVSRNGDVVHGALRLLAEVVEAEKRGVTAVDVPMALAVAVPPPDDSAPAQTDAEAGAGAGADAGAGAGAEPGAEG